MVNYDPENYYVKIDFEPKWAFIGSIRGFIENFIFNCIKNQPLGKAVALTASELLENAVKYSITEKISLEIRFLKGNTTKPAVILRVHNTTDEERISTLKTIMEDIYQFSPKDAYLKRMQEVLLLNKSDNTSQLGLARIRYECNADIKLEISQSNTVIMTASLQAAN